MEGQIILGSIVTRCPTMSLASSALLQLESACDLFDKTARLFHAENVLVRHPLSFNHAVGSSQHLRQAIMVNLREKARASFHGSRNSPSRQNSLSEPNTPADEHDEQSVHGLNLTVPEDAQALIKPWDERDDTSRFAESGVDDQVRTHSSLGPP